MPVQESASSQAPRSRSPVQVKMEGGNQDARMATAAAALAKHAERGKSPPPIPKKMPVPAAAGASSSAAGASCKHEETVIAGLLKA
jgi:hypothetical protein